MSLALVAALTTLVAAPPAFSDLGEPAFLMIDSPVLASADRSSEVLTTLPAGTLLHAMPTDGPYAQVSAVLSDGNVVDGFVSSANVAELAAAPVPQAAVPSDPHSLDALVALVTAREASPPTR